MSAGEYGSRPEEAATDEERQFSVGQPLFSGDQTLRPEDYQRVLDAARMWCLQSEDDIVKFLHDGLLHHTVLQRVIEDRAERGRRDPLQEKLKRALRRYEQEKAKEDAEADSR